MPIKTKLNPTKFREELVKIMPGYRWTIHRKRWVDQNSLSATGIQFSGSNRLSTLHVHLQQKEADGVEYQVYRVKSSGYGVRSPILYEYDETTLARALRGLQNHYEAMAQTYSNHASALQSARKDKI